MATQTNIYIDQGTDFSAGLDVIDDSGDIVDLSYATLQGQARKLYSSQVLFDFVVTVTSPTEGKALLEVDAAVTETLTPGKYKYDVMIDLSDGNRAKLLEGLVFIVDTVTKQ